MRILGTTYYGTRHITTTSKEVKSPADMVGFKLRVPENDVFKAMAEAWGAQPDADELRRALPRAASRTSSTGRRIRCRRSSRASSTKVQKYLVLSGHIITPRLVVVNEAFWQGLKADDRKIDRRTRSQPASPGRTPSSSSEKALVDTFKAAGMTVITPDVDAFRAPVLAKVPGGSRRSGARAPSSASSTRSEGSEKPENLSSSDLIRGPSPVLNQAHRETLWRDRFWALGSSPRATQ